MSSEIQGDPWGYLSADNFRVDIMAEAGTFPVHTVLRILAMRTETMGTGGNRHTAGMGVC